MKIQMFQVTLILSFCYVLCAVLFLSCNVLSRENPDGGLPPLSYGLQAHERARVTYEAETVTLSRYEGKVPDPLKEQYALRSLPSVNRSKVEVSISRVGHAYWVIEDLEPVRKIADSRRYVPDDLTPKVRRTVIREQQAHFYDASGKMIRSGRIDMPDLLQVNEFLKNAGSKNSDLRERLALAKHNGSHIVEHPNGNLTIRSRRRLSDFYRHAESVHAPEVPHEEVEIRELVDTKRNIIVATALYDRSGAVLEEALLRYRHGSTELQHIHSVSTVTDGNGVKVKHITDTYFENVKVVVADS